MKKIELSFYNNDLEENKTIDNRIQELPPSARLCDREFSSCPNLVVQRFYLSS
jgi:hypothetical protein